MLEAAEINAAFVAGQLSQLRALLLEAIKREKQVERGELFVRRAPKEVQMYGRQYSLFFYYLRPHEVVPWLPEVVVCGGTAQVLAGRPPSLDAPPFLLISQFGCLAVLALTIVDLDDSSLSIGSNPEFRLLLPDMLYKNQQREAKIEKKTRIAILHFQTHN